MISDECTAIFEEKTQKRLDKSGGMAYISPQISSDNEINGFATKEVIERNDVRLVETSKQLLRILSKDSSAESSSCSSQ